MIDKFFTCPKCHKRHLRYWPKDQLSPEPPNLASPSNARQESREEFDHLQSQGQYVCEHCKATFAKALFVFSESYPYVAVPELEGKLKTLLNTMNEHQKLQFKQAVVKQAIHYVEEMFPLEEQNDGHRIGIYRAKRWLDEPTEARAREATIAAAAALRDGGVRYFDYPSYFLDPALAAGADNAWKASRFAVEAGMDAESDRVFGTRWHGGRREEAKLAKAIALYAALEWQIEAAQVILSDAELPLEPKRENGIS
ncbi:MAG: hypothetical protein GY847_17590 [Proteobacteria bacterium]|nr:hypothetical protein [Pseudomonadota bacterium]